MKTLAQKLAELPKARQRRIAARAARLDVTLGRAYAALDHATGDRRGRAYRCPQCQRVLRRDSDKAWIKSYCDRTDRVVHLQRLKK